MPKLAVYDANNHARLLGFMYYNRPFSGPVSRVAVMPRTPAEFLRFETHPDEPLHIRHQYAEFSKETFSRRDVVESSDWYEEIVEKRTTVLTTKDDLSILMRLREFQLPNADDPHTKAAEKQGREVADNSFGAGNASFY